MRITIEINDTLLDVLDRVSYNKFITRDLIINKALAQYLAYDIRVYAMCKCASLFEILKKDK